METKPTFAQLRQLSKWLEPRKKMFYFLLEDRERTGNINMHTYDCFACTIDEAISKLHSNRPEFIGRTINQIRVDTIFPNIKIKPFYINPEFKQAIKNAEAYMERKRLELIR